MIVSGTTTPASACKGLTKWRNSLFNLCEPSRLRVLVAKKRISDIASILLLGLSFLQPCLGFTEELPRGSTENCFYIMPLFERIRVPGSLSMDEKRVQFLKMKEQLGQGNLYHRLGFSFIYGPNADAEVRQVCALAQEYRVHLGLIFGLQSHTRDDFRSVAAKDLRLFQWRKDGNDWKGSFTSTGTVEVPEDQRDYKIPTPSRYATSLREYNTIQTREWAGSVKKLMTDFPGVVTCINGPIEEELAIGGMNDQNKLADYSPFAITEFRDWLRHSGLYDASSGKYAGEGASRLIIGELVDFNGTLRSQFYDDPTPAENNGTGTSFNQFFGTSFTTWSLRYWDLDIFPDPITDVSFDCTPELGTGFCSGGFDAPRILEAGSKFWKAWSYDIPDQGGNYPQGNPAAPAFGFRQNLTRNMVRDLFEVLAASGLSREIMFAHQIPGEALANFTGAATRNRSSASTIWSGYLERSKTVGITRFGDIDPKWITQYANDWGIFEWHTLPNADPGTQALYTASANALTNYYQKKAHYLYPGWWARELPDNNSIFPLNDSRFADAIHDFMQIREEVPYHLQGTVHEYTPPQVKGVTGLVNKSGLLTVKWSERIWQDLLQNWSDWSQFASFEVQLSPDGTTWSASEKASGAVYTKTIAGSSGKVRIRAVTKKGASGSWSEIATIKTEPEGGSMVIKPEFSSMYADPDMNNNVTITFDGLSGLPDPALLTVTITGEGKIWDTTPGKAGSIEKYWPMNGPTELTGIYRLDNQTFSGGSFNATVSPLTPIDPYFSLSGSAINGTQLPYIAFRMYSDVASGGQLFWFINGGNKSFSFPVVKGWNVYSFSSLPDWISQTAINSVRLDPGVTASAKIMVDWFAIGSKPISPNLESAFIFKDNQATVTTNPTGNPGNYTVTAIFGKLTASTTVQTSSANRKPTVLLISPSKDSTVVMGTKLLPLVEANDTDGKVAFVNLLVNNVLSQKVTVPPYLFDWTPPASGSYQLVAEAVDNAGENTRSPVKTILVAEPKPFLSSFPMVPCLIEAEDYDIGGDKISFHDNDLTNKGGVYRNDPVDLIKKSDGLHGYFISWTEPGEWLSYSVEVKKAGKMDLILSVASKAGGGEIHLELNGKTVTNHQVVSSTGDDQQFKSLALNDIYLQSGIQRIKVCVDKGGFSLDFIEIRERLSTGIPGSFSPAGMLLYPNPAHDQVWINCPGYLPLHIKIVSLLGQTMKEFQLTSGSSQMLNISDLPAGVYLILGEGKEWVFREKLIKQ